MVTHAYLLSLACASGVWGPEFDNDVLLDVGCGPRSEFVQLLPGNQRSIDLGVALVQSLPGIDYGAGPDQNGVYPPLPTCNGPECDLSIPRSGDHRRVAVPERRLLHGRLSILARCKRFHGKARSENRPHRFRCNRQRRMEPTVQYRLLQFRGAVCSSLPDCDRA